MSLIKKVTFKTKNYKIRKFYINNNYKILAEFIKIKRHQKTYSYFSFKEIASPTKNQRIFYIKVHRQNQADITCIQQWLKIAEEMNAFIYFVCDNYSMQKHISKSILFSKNNFAFICSDTKTLKSQIQKILYNTLDNKRWQRVSYAMLTPFLHAITNNHNISYNIDGDDILIVAPPDKIAKAFIKAENYAIENNVDLLNLDMFVSRTYGVHWSFGAVICTNHKNCIEQLKKNVNWLEDVTNKENNLLYLKSNYNFNIDWYFTYLRDTKKLNMQTFYIENCYIAHEPDRIIFPGWSYIMHFEKNKITYPFVKMVYYGNEQESTVPIHSTNIKIDVGLTTEDYKNMVNLFFDESYKKNCKDMQFFANTKNFNLH